MTRAFMAQLLLQGSCVDFPVLLSIQCITQAVKKRSQSTQEHLSDSYHHLIYFNELCLSQNYAAASNCKRKGNFFFLLPVICGKCILNIYFVSPTIFLKSAVKKNMQIDKQTNIRFVNFDTNTCIPFYSQNQSNFLNKYKDWLFLKAVATQQHN